MTTKKAIDVYDHARFGPILGVSDEGSAAPTIAYAAYNSAKALAIGHGADEMCVGVIIDGERMGSAGEVPVGPEEYADFFPAAEGRTFCTTNVGVRVNTRIHQPYPEFPVVDAADDEAAWINKVFAKFDPFIHTPDDRPRSLTVRLTVRSDACLDTLRTLVPKLEAGRTGGDDARLGPPELHRLSFLIEFEDQIGPAEVEEIRKLVQLAAELKVPEVAVDGGLREAARRRISIQGLLNVLDEETARTLLGEAARLGVALVYHFDVDQETAARTVWTGLNSARGEGLTAAKYGLLPLTLSQQKYVVHNIQRWMADDWTPIPAFYVDTPFVTDDDVYGSDRVAEACKLWLDMVAAEGVHVVLIDAPDRIVKHRLLKSGGGPTDIGVLTLEQVEPLTRHAESLGIKALWSGGVQPDQAFELGKIGVAGIFTTGSTAHAIAVHGTMLVDEQLAAQAEPTDVGVRRIHALLQAGYLCRVLGSGHELIPQIEQGAAELLAAGKGNAAKPVIDSLNEVLIRGWKEHWSD